MFSVFAVFIFFFYHSNHFCVKIPPEEGPSPSHNPVLSSLLQNWVLSLLISLGWGLSRMMVWRGFAVTLGWNTFFLILATVILKLRTWGAPPLRRPSQGILRREAGHWRNPRSLFDHRDVSSVEDLHKRGRKGGGGVTLGGAWMHWSPSSRLSIILQSRLQVSRCCT